MLPSFVIAGRCSPLEVRVFVQPVPKTSEGSIHESLGELRLVDIKERIREEPVEDAKVFG